MFDAMIAARAARPDFFCFMQPLCDECQTKRVSCSGSYEVSSVNFCEPVSIFTIHVIDQDRRSAWQFFHRVSP